MFSRLTITYVNFCSVICANNRTNILKMISFIIYVTDIHREFQDGSTMLHLACAANNFEAVLYLETSGIDINREDKKGNMNCKNSVVYFYLLFLGKLRKQNPSLLRRLRHKIPQW